MLRPADVGPHCPHLTPLDCEREGALARVGAGTGHEESVLIGDMARVIHPVTSELWGKLRCGHITVP